MVIEEQQAIVVKHSIMDVIVLLHNPTPIRPPERSVIEHHACDVMEVWPYDLALSEVKQSAAVKEGREHGIVRFVRKVKLHVTVIHEESTQLTSREEFGSGGDTEPAKVSYFPSINSV